jgi:hypothetical protein
MTLSRIAIMMLLAAVPASVSAQTLTAEEALANHRRATALVGNDCRSTGADGEAEILVCGRRTGPSLRLPLPVEPEPGARIRGESVAASDGLKAEQCKAWGPNQRCGGGLPIMAIAVGVAKGAAKVAEAIIDPDD